MKDIIQINILEFLKTEKINSNYYYLGDDLSLKIPLNDLNNINIEFSNIYFELSFPNGYISETYDEIDAELLKKIISSIYKKDVVYLDSYHNKTLVMRQVFFSNYYKIISYEIPFIKLYKKLFSINKNEKYSISKLLE